jgi:hypothetical protein
MIMSEYVVIAKSPYVDTALVVGSADGCPVTLNVAGPLRTDLEMLGFLVEICPIVPIGNAFTQVIVARAEGRSDGDTR